MKTLNRKLVRNIWGMKGQAIAIILVIASGVATFIMSISTMQSLRQTQYIFYRDHRFAEVFASLKRAPEHLKSRIREIRGVEMIDTRVVAPIHMDITGFPDPVKGQIISVPDGGEPTLNSLYLREGSLPRPFRDNEVVVGEAFAEAHGFGPGDELGIVINGKYRTVRIVGIALSPEHIYQMPPGALFPDFERYGILWMRRTPLSAAYDMEGSFNDITLTITDDAQVSSVLERLDSMLARYGGLGAYSRKDQLSHRYLSEEFRSLEQMATMFPVIFLSVAVFLLHVVISRLVSIQREEIATLKAFGYSNSDIAIHFLKLITIIVLAGVAAGTAGGVWMGRWLGHLYTEFYRFPYLKYELHPGVVVIAAIASMAAASLGTFNSVRRAALLPPAQAMLPEPPAVYRETFVERLGLKRLISQPSRMIIRNVGRRPVKSALSVIGIGLACAIMMVGSFQGDAVDYMVDVQFGLSQLEDLTVTFVEPASYRSLYELRGMEGVTYGEPFRAVPVRLRFQHRSYRTAIQGLETGGSLQHLLNEKLEEVVIPSTGIVLSDHLGKILGVQEGDILTVEALEGSRPVLKIPVVRLVSQFIGVSAYMELRALNRLMREGNAISGVFLTVDSDLQNRIFARLKKIPGIAGVEIKEKAITKFYETMGETILIFTFVNTLLAGVIAFGVVYNSARIALSERSRELASLRVLGFTRAEISYILLGELGLFTLAAIPLGFLIGHGLCAYIVENLETDLFRVPLILEPNTYAFAALTVLVSASVSALIVRHRLDHLDLIAVLKTKE
jgi:putative ABC transport system permease protein